MEGLITSRQRPSTRYIGCTKIISGTRYDKSLFLMMDNVITLWVTAAGVPGMSVRVEVEHIHEFLAGFMYRMDQIQKEAQVPRRRGRASPSHSASEVTAQGYSARKHTNILTQYTLLENLD